MLTFIMIPVVQLVLCVSYLMAQPELWTARHLLPSLNHHAAVPLSPSNHHLRQEIR